MDVFLTFRYIIFRNPVLFQPQHYFSFAQPPFRLKGNIKEEHLMNIFKGDGLWFKKVPPDEWNNKFPEYNI